MANIQSKKKHIRQTVKRTARNRHVKSKLKTLHKNVEAAVATGKQDGVKEAISFYVSALDKAAKRGVIHHNKANRHKRAVSKKMTAMVG